jgi:hypothetical protein
MRNYHIPEHLAAGCEEHKNIELVVSQSVVPFPGCLQRPESYELRWVDG